MQLLRQKYTKLWNNLELIGCPAENNILIIGVFHGDEPQGKFLIEEYIKTTSVSISKRVINSLLFIPCLNPDGMEVNSRCNSNGVDLNRNFPTKNWGQNKGCNAACDDRTSGYYGGQSPASEIETLFVVDIIKKYTPKLVLTLHAPYKVVNYDGPAQNIANIISEIINYPVKTYIGYPTPGSFGTYCGVERNIPVITLELDEECPLQQLSKPIFEIFDKLSKYRIT